MHQWKPEKGALFVSLLSDVLELECLFDLNIVIHSSSTQYGLAESCRKIVEIRGNCVVSFGQSENQCVVSPVH